jgi:hypothetical protein
MRLFNGTEFTAIGLLALALVGLFVSPRAKGDASKEVVLTSPLPLPVTGTVGVTGPVAVTSQQSGPWNVGIIGTPTVNVNPTGNAQPGRNIDEPGRVPYQAFIHAGASNQAVFPAIPTGKRLIIEHLSAFANVTSPVLIIGFQPDSRAASNEFRLAGRTDPQTGTGNFFLSFNENFRAYADAGYVPAVSVDASTNFILFFDATLTGYLIDCTGQNSCTPVAP